MANNDIIGMHVTRVNRSRMECIVKHLIVKATYVADNVIDIYDSNLNIYKYQIPLFHARNGPISCYPLRYYGLREMRVSLVHNEQNDGTFHCCMKVQGANVPEFQINSPVLQSMATDIPLISYKSRQIASSFSTTKFEAFLAVGGNSYYYQKTDQNIFYGCKPAIFDRLFQGLDEKGQALVLCTFMDQTGALQACIGVNCNQLPLNPLSQESRRNMILQRRPVLGSSFNNNNNHGRSREGSNFHPDSNLLSNRNNYTYVGRGAIRRDSSALADHERNRLEREARFQMGIPEIGDNNSQQADDDDEDNNEGDDDDLSHHGGGGDDHPHDHGQGPPPGGGGGAGGGGNGQGGYGQGRGHHQGGGGLGGHQSRNEGNHQNSGHTQPRQNERNNNNQQINETNNNIIPGGHLHNNDLPEQSINASQSSHHTPEIERNAENDPLLDAVMSGAVRDAGELSQLSQRMGAGDLSQTRVLEDEMLNPIMSTGNHGLQDMNHHFGDLSPISSRNSLFSNNDMEGRQLGSRSAPADGGGGRFHVPEVPQDDQPTVVQQGARGGGAGQSRRPHLQQVPGQDQRESLGPGSARSANWRNRGSGANTNRGAGAGIGSGAGGRNAGPDNLRGRERFGGRGGGYHHSGNQRTGAWSRGTNSNRAGRQAPSSTWRTPARRSWPDLSGNDKTGDPKLLTGNQEQGLHNNFNSSKRESYGTSTHNASVEGRHDNQSQQTGGNSQGCNAKGGGRDEDAVSGLHQTDQQTRGGVESGRHHDLPEGDAGGSKCSDVPAEIYSGPAVREPGNGLPASQVRDQVSERSFQGSKTVGGSNESHPNASSSQSVQTQGPRSEAGGKADNDRALQHENGKNNCQQERDPSTTADERELQASKNQLRMGSPSGDIFHSSQTGGRDHRLRGVQRGGRGGGGDSHGNIELVSRPFSANDTWPPPENVYTNPFDHRTPQQIHRQQQIFDSSASDTEARLFSNLTPVSSVVIGEKRKNPSTDSDDNDPMYQPTTDLRMDSNDAEDEMTMADEVNKEYDPGPTAENTPSYTPSSTSSQPMSSTFSSTSEERDTNCLIQFLGSSDSERQDLHRELDRDVNQRSAVKAISTEMRLCHEKFKQWQLMISEENVTGQEGLQGLDKLIRSLLMLQSKVDHGGYNLAVCTTTAVLKRINLVKMEINACKQLVIDQEDIKLAQKRENENREQSRKFQEQKHQEQLMQNAKVQQEILEAQRRRSMIHGAAAAAVAGPQPPGLEEEIQKLATEGDVELQQQQQEQQQSDDSATDAWSNTESARRCREELAANPALGLKTGNTPMIQNWSACVTPANVFRGRESENVGESLLSTPSPLANETESFALAQSDITLLPNHLLWETNLPMPSRPSIGHELEVAAASSSGPSPIQFPDKGDASSVNLLMSSGSNLESPESKSAVSTEANVPSLEVSPPTPTTSAPGASSSPPDSSVNSLTPVNTVPLVSTPSEVTIAETTSKC